MLTLKGECHEKGIFSSFILKYEVFNVFQKLFTFLFCESAYLSDLLMAVCSIAGEYKLPHILINEKKIISPVRQMVGLITKHDNRHVSSTSNQFKICHLCVLTGYYPPFMKRTNLRMVPVPNTKQHCSSSWLTCLTLCGFARFFQFGFRPTVFLSVWFLAHDWYLYIPYIYCTYSHSKLS